MIWASCRVSAFEPASRPRRAWRHRADENRDTVSSQTIDLSCDIADLMNPCRVCPAGRVELLPVLRRLTAIVVIWASLLWAAAPALACSLSAFNKDCCPAGTSAPCAGQAGSARHFDAVEMPCCASGQATVADAAIDSGHTSHERGHYPASPDPFVLIAWSASWLAPVPTTPGSPSRVRPPPSFAALTYLHTARLRL
jgi:hypothetical protein